jgi:molybdate transport system ATP-binding protein
MDIALKGKLGSFELDVGFVAPARGVTGIFGPSGCGKTTFLRALAGLERLPGHVRIGGNIWQDARNFVPVHKRRAGMVFQEPSLFTHLSVEENLDFAVKRHKTSPIKLPDVSAKLGLGPLLGRNTRKLSGGERQRVALGRVLLSAPKLLLMDEPLSSLDQSSKAEILPLISAMSESFGIPVLYVSHDPIEISYLTDRVFRMKAGQMLDVAATAPDISLQGMTEDDIRALALKALIAGL